MGRKEQDIALQLVDDLVAEGKSFFTFNDAMRRLNRSASGVANLLQRMVDAGLVDRIRRGRYVIRNIGVLGTNAAAEDLALVVAAAFCDRPHRIGYRSALDELDLLSHPARIIQVATTKRMRVDTLSGRSLRIILESEMAIGIGALSRGQTKLSDLERALLDAAARIDLAGGAAVLAEALVAGGKNADPKRISLYAEQLGWAAALRRIGSISDALEIEGFSGKLHPLKQPQADIDLEPHSKGNSVWRDARWRVRWTQPREELRNVAWQ